jgi:hypothetical protein
VASDNFVELLRLGPFTGLDSTTSPAYLQDGFATAVNHADLSISPGSLATGLGRVTLATLQVPGEGPSKVFALAPYYPTSSSQQFLFSTSSGYFGTNQNQFNNNVALYDMNSGTTTAVEFGSLTYADLGTFNQGVQMGGVTYLSNGLQYSSLNPANAYYWQVPAPTGGISVTKTTDPPNGLPEQHYYYAFTYWVVQPNQAVDDGHETNPFGVNPTGASPPTYPFTVNINGPNQNPEINTTSGSFSTVLPDGSTAYLVIYRQSDNQPVWLQVVNTAFFSLTPPYIDAYEDVAISANQDLSQARWAPPNVVLSTPYNFPTRMQSWPIEAHKNRMWMFAAVPNTIDSDSALQNDTPQLQLWYSNYGRGWEFDAVNQVMLIEDEDTPNFQYTQDTNQFLEYPDSAYGEWPVALASMSGLLVVFKRKSFWIVFGDDENTFTPTKVADIGCIAGNSVTKTPGSVFWLSEQGAYFYDGNAPQYISEKIRTQLQEMDSPVLQSAVGGYKNLTWYLSFPGVGTYSYYIPTREWSFEEFNSSVFYADPAAPEYAFGPLIGELLGININSLDSWAVSFLDFGKTVGATWTGPLTGSRTPQGASLEVFQKEYNYLVIVAPYQVGCSVVATLTIDPGMPTQSITSYTFPLDSGETRHIARITTPDANGNAGLGYLAQLSITVYNNENLLPHEQFSAIIYSASVWGQPRRAFTLPT